MFLLKWQHASGMSLPLLQFLSIPTPHLEGHYYVHIRNFLAQNNLQIEVQGISPILFPRENDECIMDVACADPAFGDGELRKMFYCKCYLEVTWLSDMCTANGEQILVGHYDDICSSQSSASKFKEIIQE